MEHSSRAVADPVRGRRATAPALAIVAVSLVAAGEMTTARGQELEARTYSNIPVGLNILIVGYAYSNGNIFMDPALPIEGLVSKNHLLFASYGRSFALYGRSAKLAVMLPGTFQDWKGTIESEFGTQTRTASGVGDARVAIAVNLKGAPALRPAEFASYEQQTIIGARLQMAVPTGSYDPDELVNLGSNRWTFIPEVGVSHSFSRWTLEATGAMWFFTDNDRFLGSTLSQRPLMVVTGHAIRRLRPGFWLGLGVGFGDGGRTEVDGVPRDTKQRNWRFAVAVSYPLRRAHGLRGTLLKSVAQGAGQEFDVLSLAYSYSWGGSKK
jgi:hypothetical protein